ncbi:MAG: extracellular solute-binding protein [Clostridiales bacterium]|nr:extracellular solute-binding protein [Clostridiales bacterium]
MRKQLTFILTCCMLLSSTACNSNSPIKPKGENVLRIASWDEYIDMGGTVYEEDDPDLLDFIDWYKDLTGIDLKNARPIYEEFQDWYNKENPDSPIIVEYIPLQDNETMYNKIKMGDEYDLLCPSEYMAMKLKSENLLQPYSQEFFDTTIEENYYAKNVSAYTKDIFSSNGLSEYIAGYMWGSTGFVYNPQKIGASEDEAREIMSSWYCLSNPACERKITAKDNVRDSYFMGLGMYYEKELLALNPNTEDYAKILSSKMNDVSKETMPKVKALLEKARKNLYGLETDEGKTDVAAGRLDASYQWSGDAVYIMDTAEENDLMLEYSIPKSASNLWFDGWVMMNNANTKAATAFVNYISRPENVIRNMYYIGYTSCIAGTQVYDYVDYTYGDEEGTATYDLSYFFGSEFDPLLIDESQSRRQLFAQYPDEVTKNRLVVMEYFDPDENERANRMWNNIK